MKKIEILILSLLVFSGFVVRFYRFDNPIADWHSWRQADTSAVSRNFVKHGFDLLHPKFDDLSNVASGKENPQGYRFVEFPIYNFFQAVLFTIFGYLNIEQWGRVVSIFSSLLSALFLYLLCKKYANITVASLVSFFFLFLPFSIYYSRSILPDEMMVMAILGGTYFFSRWIENNSKFKIPVKDEARSSCEAGLWRQNSNPIGSDSKLQFKIKNYLILILSIIFTSSAFLLKPYALFFTLPMFYLTYKAFGLSFFKKWQLWLFLVLSIIPLILWRYWMYQFPEGIPANDWLLNGGGIRFKGAFFYWIFGERLSKLILGYLGIFLFFTGLLKKETEKNYLLFISFLLSSLLYLFVIARGNVQHDYYQILIIPTLSIFLARGAEFLLSFKVGVNKILSKGILLTVILGMFSFSWYYVRDYFNINNWSMVAAGKAADKVIPYDAKVIVPYDGDTSFLYQTGRQGWPVFEKSIEELIVMGASYLVIADPTENDFSGFGKKYEIVLSSNKYLILKLK